MTFFFVSHHCMTTVTSYHAIQLSIWRSQNQWKHSFVSFLLFWQIYWLVGWEDFTATPARLISCCVQLSTRCSPKVVEYIWCCACTWCCILDAVLVLVLHLVLYSAKVLEYNNAPQAFPTRPRRDKVLRRNVIGNCVDHFFSSIFFPT